MTAYTQLVITVYNHICDHSSRYQTPAMAATTIMGGLPRQDTGYFFFKDEVNGETMLLHILTIETSSSFN